MSRVETYIGKLTKVRNGSVPNEFPVSLEELCKRVLKRMVLIKYQNVVTHIKSLYMMN
jgi:hypothetical protein